MKYYIEVGSTYYIQGNKKCRGPLMNNEGPSALPKILHLLFSSILLYC